MLEGFTRRIAISIRGEIAVVTRGDVLIDQYEVLRVEEESSEVLDKSIETVKKLIEKES